MKLNLLSKSIMLFLFAVLFAFGTGEISAQSSPQILTGTGTFTVPCGVTSLKIRAVGGGGGGGVVGNAGQGTGGGGGGAYAEITTYPVKPGDTFTYSAGSGGNGTVDNSAGGSTTVSLLGTVVLSANGGGGATGGNPGVGATTGTTGDVKFGGGNGFGGSAANIGKSSGGGGGAGSSAGRGNDATSIIGATAATGSTYGGKGGDGKENKIVGAVGGNYGGGGGGSVGAAGGNGGPGVVVFEYTVAPAGVITMPATPPTVCVNTAISFNLSTSNVSGAVVSGLPQGVTGSFQNNVVTIGGTPTVAGTFTYVITANNCPTNSFSGTIIVNPAVTAGTISPANTTICAGSTTTLTSNGTGGGTWSSSNANVATVSSTGVVTGKVAGTTTITYTVTGCGSGNKTAIATITVNATTVITKDPQSFTGSYCNGSSAGALIVEAAGTNLNYEWYKSTNIAGPFVKISVDPTSSSYTPSTASAGTVYYYVKVIGTCGTLDSKVATVRVGADNVWDGTNWSETGTSSNMPGYTAVIAAAYNTATNGAITACNIRVNSNISFTVDGSNGATIQNDISNNGTITVKSGANLIQVSPAGQYTGAATSFIVEREAKALENNYPQKIDFVYWSSPVKAQTFAAFSPKAYAIREYLESSDRFTPTADASFVAAKGYSVWAETDKPGPYDKTYRFRGVPNNGDINIAVKLAANGYNLVGNPYPSNLNFDQLVADNSNTIYNVMYRWKTAGLTATPTNGSKAYVDTNYIVYTGTGSNVIGETGDISVGQGFIIQSKIAGVLNFKNSMRTTAAAKFYDKQVSVRDRFWLQLTTPEKMENTLLIGYVDGATDGYDDDFDGESFTLSSDLFYSFLDKTRLIIQGKSPDFKISDRILLGANLYGKGMHTISLAKAEGRFASSQKIYLKDNKTKTYTDLTAGSYTFDAEAGINDNRFEIVYVAGVLGTDIVAKSKLIVYKQSNLFIVHGGKKMKGVEMYDVSGRLVKNTAAASDSLEIPIDSLASGLYILRVNYEDGTVQTKKVLK